MLQREGWRKMFDCYFLKQADMQKVKKGVFFEKKGHKRGNWKTDKEKTFFRSSFSVGFDVVLFC